MSEQKQSIQTSSTCYSKFFKLEARTYYLALLIFAVTVLVVWKYCDQFGFNFPSEKGDFGTLGDYIGGVLNPIFALFSFLALLFTIRLQIKQLEKTDLELQLNRDELELTRIELTKAANAQVETKKVMDEQLRTQSLQQFDSLFFSMLRELNTILTSLEDHNSGQNSILYECYEMSINQHHESIESSIQTILSDKSISRYFIYLYQLLKLIDDRIENNTYIHSQDEKNILKKMYSNIVRASIPEIAMQLLMLNAANKEFSYYKELLEKFSFFEHVSFKKNAYYSFLLIHTSKLYKEKAFDRSIHFKGLKNSYLFNDYIVKNNLYKYSDLIKNIFTNIDKNKMLGHGSTFTQGRSAPESYFICTPEIVNDSRDIKIQIKSNTYEPYKWQVQEINNTTTYRTISDTPCSLSIKYPDILVYNRDSKEILLIIKLDKEDNLSCSTPDITE